MRQFHSLRIDSIRQDTHNAIVLTLAVPASLKDAFSYVQGQHLTVRAWVNGGWQHRSYSICSAAQEQQLKIAIKRVPGGVFSNWAHDELKPGDSIDVLPPAGFFNVPLDAMQSRRYIGFAAGSGITPLLSIAKTTLLTEKTSRFTLVYGNSTLASVMFRDDLADLKDRFIDRFNVIHIFSRDFQEIDLLHGRLTREKCEDLFRRWLPVADIDHAFVCGPASMMQSVSHVLTAHGVPTEKIKMEYFAPVSNTMQCVATPDAALIDEETDEECALTLIIDGVSRTLSMSKRGATVLDAALGSGIDVRFSCKGGVCATCRCKVVEGKVEMNGNYALQQRELSQGFVLSCRSVPVSDRVVLDFDQIA